MFNRAILKTIVIQTAIVAVIVLVVALIANTTFANLNRLGVQSGFNFLFERSGFDINQKLISFSSDSPIYMAFAVAVLNTILLAVLSIIFSTILGLVIAICRISGDWFLNAFGYGFVEIFRNIPALLQIFLVYFVVIRALPSFRDSYDLFGTIYINNRGVFLPSISFSSDNEAIFAILFGLISVLAVLGIWKLRINRTNLAFNDSFSISPWLIFMLWVFLVIGLSIALATFKVPTLGKFGYQDGLVISPELVALIIGLSTYNASYLAEIMRAGFQAVSKGQREASQALGLGAAATFRHIIFPQALRIVIPPITNIYLNIFKSTSLGAAIGYPEIVSVLVGTTNNLVGRPIEIMFMTFLTYSLISLLAAMVMHRVNQRYNRYNVI